MRRRSPKLMLLAAAASLLIGLLFALLPGRADPSFRRWIGIVRLVTGAIWLLSWWRQRPRSQST